MALYKLLPVSPLCGSIPINLMEETMAGGYGDSGGKKRKRAKGDPKKEAALVLIAQMKPEGKPEMKPAKRPKGEKTMA